MKTNIKIGRFELIGITNILIFIFSITFWLITCFSHLRVTNILIHTVITPWGRFVPRDYTFHAGITLFTLLCFYIIYRFVTGTRSVTTLIYWALIISTILLSFRYLITAPIEIIHFPQYAIPSVLLAHAFDKDKKKFVLGAVFFWVTIMGIIDEMNQYFYITKQYTEYLDWNDFFLNEQGAAIGLLIYYGFQNKDKRKLIFRNIIHSTGVKFILLISTVVLFLSFLDVLKFSTPIKLSSSVFMDEHNILKIYFEKLPGKYGSWQERDLGGYFYTLNCIYGPLIMSIFGFIFYSFSYNLFKKDKIISSIK